MPLDRRSLLTRLLVAPMLAAMPAVGADPGLSTRRWQSAGIDLPLLGLGTWQSFDVAAGSSGFAEAVGGLQAFLDGGGRVIDTSPMYGQAEAALGAALADVTGAGRAWLASKIWTRGTAAGQRQFEQTRERIGRPRIELMQIHNLLDAEVHLRTLQAARDAGALHWIGVTHYQAGAHAELARWLQRDAVDSLQVNYSLAEPEAGKWLLPAAREAGKLVLINRPFAEGRMFARSHGQPLPGVAAELGCASAAQLFLKWIAADPAVHVVLTGTRKPRHIADNLAGARGPFPDATQRTAIARWWADLPG